MKKKLAEWASEHMVALIASIVAAVIVIVLMVVFWGWLSDGESGSTTIRNVGLVIGGAIALGIAGWRSVVADRQAGTAQQDLLNKRYQEGAAMLGNEVLSVRLAGIYALQRLAQDHPWEYHIEVMKSLCAFARNPTKDEGLMQILAERWEAAMLSRARPTPELREDVQAALDAIGICHERQLAIEAAQKFWLDLHGAELRGANLQGRKLASAPLADGKFGSIANVLAFRPGPDFSGAKLQSANMTLADLRSADFTDANLQAAECVAAHLSDVTFVGADLEGALLYEARPIRRSVLPRWTATGERLDAGATRLRSG